MSPYAIGILAGLVVILVPALLILKPSNRRQINVFGDILDVDEVMERSRAARQMGRGKRFATDHPDLFAKLLKLSGINFERIEKEVYRANVTRFSAEDIVAVQLVALYGGGVLLLMLIFMQAKLSILALVGVIILVAFVYPRNVITRLIRQREQEFIKNFPDFLDSIEIPLSNGLPILRVLERVSDRFPGIIGQEIRRVVLESKAQGDRIQQPLEDLIERIHSPIVSDFVSAFLTALRTGTNLGQVVANMSRSIRIASTQQQEEANRKKVNPILMITMIFFMFPFLIVTVAPMLINVFGALSGRGF